MACLTLVTVAFHDRDGQDLRGLGLYHPTLASSDAEEGGGKVRVAFLDGKREPRSGRRRCWWQLPWGGTCLP